MEKLVVVGGNRLGKISISGKMLFAHTGGNSYREMKVLYLMYKS